MTTMITSFVRTAKIAAACATLLAGAAHAQTAKDYNVFVFGNYTASGSDVEGRLAAGGTVTISGYSVGSQLDASQNSLDNLVAGGTLNFSNGQLYHGNAVGGTLNLGGGASIPNGTARAGTSGLDFVAEQARMLGISSALSAEATTGTINWQSWGGYFLTGTDSGLNVFNISGANLATTNTFSITAASDAFVLVNVSGVADMFRFAGTTLSGGITAEHVLFNFYDATSLTLAGISVPGTVLAPKANVDFSNGNLNGTLIALSMTGNGEFHDHLYAGTQLDTPISVPEPASWLMLIGGFGLAGAALRRSKRRASALA
jgi:choice-of-anchor A domain-containing protein